MIGDGAIDRTAAHACDRVEGVIVEPRRRCAFVSFARGAAPARQIPRLVRSDRGWRRIVSSLSTMQRRRIINKYARITGARRGASIA